MGVLSDAVEAGFAKIDRNKKNGVVGVPNASDVWTWVKDIPSAERGAAKAESEARRISGDIAKLMDAFDETEAERKRIGDDLIAKRKAVGAEEAAVVAGDGNAKKVEKAAGELERAAASANDRRQRLREKANALKERALALTDGFAAAMHTYAAASENLAFLRMDAERDSITQVCRRYEEAEAAANLARNTGQRYDRKGAHRERGDRCIFRARRFAEGGSD